jgi:hypothetical protein
MSSGGHNWRPDSFPAMTFAGRTEKANAALLSEIVTKKKASYRKSAFVPFSASTEGPKRVGEQALIMEHRLRRSSLMKESGIRERG